MKDHLDRLDLVMGAQIACLTAIKNWLPRKVELIKSNRRDELEAFTLREDEQVSRLQQAESQRQVIVGMMARELGLSGPVSLSTLMGHLGEADRARLTDRGNQLAALVERIREGQELASELLRVSLEYVHFTMDVFAQLATAAPATSYGRFGDLTPPTSASWLLDRQA